MPGRDDPVACDVLASADLATLLFEYFFDVVPCDERAPVLPLVGTCVPSRVLADPFSDRRCRRPGGAVGALLRTSRGVRAAFAPLVAERGHCAFELPLSRVTSLVFTLVPHAFAPWERVRDEDEDDDRARAEQEEEQASARAPPRYRPARVEMPYAWRVEAKSTLFSSPLRLALVAPCDALWEHSRRALGRLGDGSIVHRAARQWRAAVLRDARVVLSELCESSGGWPDAIDLQESLDDDLGAPMHWPTLFHLATRESPLLETVRALGAARRAYVNWSYARGARRLGAVVVA